MIVMNLKIYLFRHGRTYFNEEERFTGWKDSRLTKDGIKNAVVISKKLRNRKIDVAFETRLSRSRQTLKDVLKYHPECKKIIIDDRMIERSYGLLEGKFHKTIIKKCGIKRHNIWHRSYNISPPQGESIKTVEKRVLSFIKDLIEFMKKSKVNVAISAHGNSMRPFRRYFEKWSVNHMMDVEMPYDKYFEYTIRA